MYLRLSEYEICKIFIEDLHQVGKIIQKRLIDSSLIVLNLSVRVNNTKFRVQL